MRFRPAPIQTYHSRKGTEVPVCAKCGQFIVKDENGKMPETCPRCGSKTELN